MARTLCKKQKALRKDPAAFAEMVRDPRFLCSKCGRAANKKKYVCSPRKLEPENSSVLQVA